MEEKDLIVLLNSITYGEMSLNELLDNNLTIAKVINEIHLLYNTIRNLRVDLSL